MATMANVNDGQWQQWRMSTMDNGIDGEWHRWTLSVMNNASDGHCQFCIGHRKRSKVKSYVTRSNGVSLNSIHRDKSNDINRFSLGQREHLQIQELDRPFF